MTSYVQQEPAITTYAEPAAVAYAAPVITSPRTTYAQPAATYGSIKPSPYGSFSNTIELGAPRTFDVTASHMWMGNAKTNLVQGSGGFTTFR
jgi:hypothetical protein